MSDTPYETVFDKETTELQQKELALSPWLVQSLVFRIIQNHLLTNDPRESGFPFDQKYSTRKEESQIELGISFNWKPDTASKRPAIFISRGNADVRYPTMSGRIGANPAESEESKLALVSLPIKVSVVASPIGFVETLAEYVRQPLMYYAQTIQCDFGFQRFRLLSISKPEIYVEAKDNFIVELLLQVEYADTWKIKGDHLKLKTFSMTIFDSIYEKPLENQ